MVGRFVDPGDATVETFAVVRTAPAAETITARTENFSEVLERPAMERALSNTILVTALVVIGVLFTSIMGGYAFARIEPVPDIDRENSEVTVTFYVDPGKRAYVRQINFLGVESIQDQVLRREMRQMEGAFLSNRAVERSEQRVRRLPFIEEVESETRPVPGSDDLVDIDFNVTEGQPGSFGGGLADPVAEPELGRLRPGRRRAGMPDDLARQPAALRRPGDRRADQTEPDEGDALEHRRAHDPAPKPLSASATARQPSSSPTEMRRWPGRP